MHPLNSERYVHTFKDITNFSGTINVTYRYLAGTPLPRKSIIIYLFLFGVMWHSVIFDVIKCNFRMQNNVEINGLLVFSAMTQPFYLNSVAFIFQVELCTVIIIVRQQDSVISVFI